MLDTVAGFRVNLMLPEGLDPSITLWGYGKLNALGSHLLVELRDCNSAVLQSLEKVRSAMVSAAEAASATIVDVSFHEFSPFGISGMVIIAESHLSIHTWPEYGYAAVDIFTCGDLIKPSQAAAYLIEQFESRNPSVVEMKRGIIDPLRNLNLPHKVADNETLSPIEAAT